MNASPVTLGTAHTRMSVLVLGEALIDRFSDAEVIGGAPFNVARSLAAFGVPTTMVTRVGADDDAGRRILANAQAFGLPTEAIQRDASHATGIVTITEREGDHRFHIHTDAAWDHLALAPALAAMRRSQPQLVYFGTLAQRSPVAAATIAQLLDQTRALRFLDLNLRAGQDNRAIAAQSLERADWVKVNDEELRSLLVWFVPACDAAAAPDSVELRRGITQLMQRFQLARLVVTRGAAGYAAFDARGQCLAQGPAAKGGRRVDTVGAGDAFTAALLAGWSAGFSSQRALDGANRYAAAICGERGPLPQDPEFFRSWRWALGLISPAPAPVSLV